eukprot:1562693-Rhodomonas_salina.2
MHTCAARASVCLLQPRHRALHTARCTLHTGVLRGSTLVCTQTRHVSSALPLSSNGLTVHGTAKLRGMFSSALRMVLGTERLYGAMRSPVLRSRMVP